VINFNTNYIKVSHPLQSRYMLLLKNKLNVGWLPSLSGLRHLEYQAQHVKSKQ